MSQFDKLHKILEAAKSVMATYADDFGEIQTILSLYEKGEHEMTDAGMLDAIDGKICWCLDELTDRLAGIEVTEQIVHLSTSIKELMQARKLFNEICKGMEPKHAK